MKDRKLNYRFHDPNPASAAAGRILDIFIEAGAGKVERAVREAAETVPGPDGRQGHPA